MSDWQPIETAPKDGAAVHARDADGDEHVTRFFYGSWVYTGWRETEDRDEYETEEWWEPTEWLPYRPGPNNQVRRLCEGD